MSFSCIDLHNPFGSWENAIAIIWREVLTSAFKWFECAMSHVFLKKTVAAKVTKSKFLASLDPFVKANGHIDVSVNVKGRDSDVKKMRKKCKMAS